MRRCTKTNSAIRSELRDYSHVLYRGQKYFKSIGVLTESIEAAADRKTRRSTQLALTTRGTACQHTRQSDKPPTAPCQHATELFNTGGCPARVSALRVKRQAAACTTRRLTTPSRAAFTLIPNSRSVSKQKAN